MRTHCSIFAAAIAIALCSTANTVNAGVTPLGTAFTYQGLLKSNGSPANGTFHLRFQLWDALAAGAQVGSDLNVPAQSVADGFFTTPLDFGSNLFDGSARWLQIQVITNGGATVTTLLPRQPITAAPYSLQTRGIFVNDAGQVGIGLNSPATALHVNGADNNGSTAGLRIDSAAQSMLLDGNEIDTNTAVGLFLNNNNPNNVILVNGGGNVGIGTTSPLETLHVAGSMIADGDIRAFNPNDPTSEVFLGWGLDSIGNDVARIRVGGSGPGATNGLDIQRTSNVSLMRITHDGRVGIGVPDPTFALEVDIGSLGGIKGTGTTWGLWGNNSASFGSAVHGQADSAASFDFYAAGAGMNYGASSSLRWKRNIEAIRQPLDMISQLRGVYFDWDAEHGNHHDVGMIAEEVGRVLPEIVIYEPNGIDATGMDYSKLTPLLVESVKALRAEKDAEIESLRTEIAELKALVHQLTSTRNGGTGQ